jgi:flagellar hook assembly protein FlgD
VRATVYDIRGRAVRRLLDKALASGEHRIEFNGKDDAGEALPSGMYLCRFNFRDREEVVKATLVK